MCGVLARASTLLCAGRRSGNRIRQHHHATRAYRPIRRDLLLGATLTAIAEVAQLGEACVRGAPRPFDTLRVAKDELMLHSFCTQRAQRLSTPLHRMNSGGDERVRIVCGMLAARGLSDGSRNGQEETKSFHVERHG